MRADLAAAILILVTIRWPPNGAPLLAVANPNPNPTPAPVAVTVTVTVTQIVDGDTVHVSTPTGPDIVRALGIDTPESKKPGAPVQCGGPEASAFAHDLLTSQRVTLIADPTQQDRDQRHRLLRYLRLADGRDYSIAAARAGMAHNYWFARKPVTEQNQIADAEADARAARRGMWGHCA